MFKRIFKTAAAGNPAIATVDTGPNRWPVPLSVHSRCYDPDLLRSLHGLSPGDSYCPCGAAVGESYESRCSGCGRPYPLACLHCGAWVPSQDVAGMGWYSPSSECARCHGDAAVAARSSILRQIPDDVRGGASNYVRDVASRAGATDILKAWAAADCGRVPPARPFLWIAGGHRTGKSVAIARAVSDVVEQGRIRSLVWTTYGEIIGSAKVRFLGEGGDLLSRCRSAGVLVVDEAFGDEEGARSRTSPRRRDTESSLATFVDVLRKRAASRMPTIIAGLWGLQALRDVAGESAHDRIACVCEIADIGDRQVNGEI
jgi:hypothetical protein